MILPGKRTVRRQLGSPDWPKETHMSLTSTPFLAALPLLGCATSPAEETEEEPTKVEVLAAETGPSSAGEIGGVAPRQIVAMFGAELLDGVSQRELAGYQRVFGFGDSDGDGRHSKKEYVDDGRYMTRQARQGIFGAADSDDDGFVTREEYVLNRAITDEAKLIYEDMDADGDGRLTAEELVGSGKLEDKELAEAVFKALDTNGDGALNIPEYLRVWGRWARS